MSRCSECGGSVLWNEDASSNICTTCGTLTDPSQRVLADNGDQVDSQYFNPYAPNTLKHLRGGSSWALTGQSKEARIKNNTVCGFISPHVCFRLTMHEFIKSMTLTLSVSGLSSRVCNLFDQAMRTTQFKWGTKAKAVAGACLSIALRESGRPDYLKDIAFLVEQTDVNLKRTLSSVLSALNLPLPSSNPAQFLITLQSHLQSILQSPVETCGINVSLWSELKLLSIHQAVETSRLFIDVLSRSTFETSLIRCSPAATACAIFIMSLETEKRGPLSCLAAICTCFADLCTVAKVAVMKRYQTLNEEVSRWIKEVEWLDSYPKTSQRTKVSKRLICARGLKDVLNWRTSLLENSFETGGKPNLTPQMNNSEYVLDIEQPSSQDIPSSDDEDLQSSRKRRRVHSAITTGTHFLLNPLGASSSRQTSTTFTSCHLQGVSPSLKRDSPESSMTYSYLLSCASFSDTRVLPSRLQQLSIARGGADVVHDDELLAEGEWEAIQRTPEEMRHLEQRWRDDGVLDAIEKARSLQQLGTRKRKAKEFQGEPSPDMVRHSASKRIDLEALSSFMLDSDEGYGQVFDLNASELLGLEMFDDDMDDKGSDDETIVYNEGNEAGAFHAASEPGIGDEITVDDWRPPSPGSANPLDDYYL
ncbi:hypothetical protein EV361DRAFT_788902 [Lentinula raphanica]|nr:hypothetical protein EV361DRAFT_788902 [Lentinula raphanica]